jgi:hypothetical protein
MTLQHAALTDAADIHEPKGADSAVAGAAYVSDGAGSGDWLPVQQAQYACLRATSSGDTTGVTTDYQALNNAALGGTIAYAVNVADGITADATSGYMTIPDTGVYQIVAAISLVAVTNPSVYSFTIGVDSGAGIISKEAAILTQIKTTSTSDTKAVSIVCLPSLTAGDKVYLMVKEDSGHEFELIHLNYTLVRVK